jgi:hypothetical protein
MAQLTQTPKVLVASMMPVQAPVEAWVDRAMGKFV